LQRHLKREGAEDEEMMDEETAAKDPVTRLFGLEMQCTFKNVESDIEPEVQNAEHPLKLSCHIHNNTSNLIEGLEGSLMS